MFSKDIVFFGNVSDKPRFNQILDARLLSKNVKANFGVRIAGWVVGRERFELSTTCVSWMSVRQVS
jgi:hypothetical protein